MTAAQTTTTAPQTPQRDTVLRSVRRAVVNGELRPGDRLREVALAGELGVSRATLREALNGMVQSGLLSHQPYRGYAVAALDAATIRDLATTRVSLDLIAVRAICADTSGSRLDQFAALWSDVSHRILDEDPLVQHEAHIAFHHGLWGASGNQMLMRLWPVTEALMIIALAQEQAVSRDPLGAYRLHRRLVEAIVAGDVPLVEQLLAVHTIDAAEHVIASTSRHANVEAS